GSTRKARSSSRRRCARPTRATAWRSRSACPRVPAASTTPTPTPSARAAAVSAAEGKMGTEVVNCDAINHLRPHFPGKPRPAPCAGLFGGQDGGGCAGSVGLVFRTGGVEGRQRQAFGGDAPDGRVRLHVHAEALGVV